MAFSVSRSNGNGVPDLIGKIAVDKDLVINGQAVELDGTVAVAASPVAAVITASYAGPTGLATDASFSPTFPKGADGSDKVLPLMVPVTGTLLFDADIVESASTVVGSEVNLNASGQGLVYNAAGTDFRVLEIVSTGATGPDVVRGVFLLPGYFAS